MSETAKRTIEMKYLLGTLSEDESTRMEEAFFADDAKFEELELAEDELIDSYVRQELSDEERRRFEAVLLKSPRLLERLYFARALAEKTDSLAKEEAPELIYTTPLPPPRKSKFSWKGLFTQQPVFGVAFAPSAVVFLVAGAVIVSGWLQLRNQSEQLGSARAELQRQKEELDKLSGEQRTKTEQLTAELKREREERAKDLLLIEEQRNKLNESTRRQSPLTSIATLFLVPGSVRSGNGRQPELTLDPGTTTARLQLAITRDEYQTYKAKIMTAEGREVFTKSGLRSHKIGSDSQLILFLPSGRLTPGDYTVHLEGVDTSGRVENVDDYAFRVRRK